MSQEEADQAMREFQGAVEAFLALSVQEQRRRLDEAASRAAAENARFLRAISFTTQEERDFLHQPMTI